MKTNKLNVSRETMQSSFDGYTEISISSVNDKIMVLHKGTGLILPFNEINDLTVSPQAIVFICKQFILTYMPVENCLTVTFI